MNAGRTAAFLHRSIKRDLDTCSISDGQTNSLYDIYTLHDTLFHVCRYSDRDYWRVVKMLQRSIDLQRVLQGNGRRIIRLKAIYKIMFAKSTA